MSTTRLSEFIARANTLIRQQTQAVDCVMALAPLMLELVKHATEFLKPEHYQSHPEHYARNLIYDAPDANLSLYALVWSPGQWTPVHDHGSWGVVSVLEGVLEERSFVRMSGSQDSNDHIELVRGGIILLTPGAVTSFVPNPDHIHITGVPKERPRAVSLHLYGRAMSSFNVYDVVEGTRKRVQLTHNES